MANFHGTERTNAFRVKNRQAFLDWASERGLEVEVRALENGDERFILYPRPDAYCGRFPIIVDEAGPQWGQPINIPEEVSTHLKEGEVAIFQGCGWEGRRYVSGWATAINWQGKQCAISLDEIYKLAVRRLKADPDNLTLAQYESSRTFSRPR